MFVRANATAAIFHICFVAFAPRYRARYARTEGNDVMPAMSAPRVMVPAMVGSREAADMAVGYVLWSASRVA